MQLIQTKNQVWVVILNGRVKQMISEEDNKEKRKTIPLTNSESLTFFFMPFGFFGINRFKNNDYNESELERFRKYGFDLKVKQAKELTICGRAFYIAITLIIIYFLKFIF